MKGNNKLYYNQLKNSKLQNNAGHITDFSVGGPTFSEYTIYQVVAVPAQQTIWLKTLDYSGWEKVELGPLFAN